MVLALTLSGAIAQAPPSASDLRRYTGLHAAAAQGQAAVIDQLIAAGNGPDGRDPHSRTPLHVAVHFGHLEAARALLRLGADANVRESQNYDPLTIAAVRDDLAMLKLLISNGANARNVTSPYQGTALIAAAHLGHDDIVQALIEAKAPLNHVNNLGWTALIEAIVLGDGGPRHTRTLQHLISAGANVNLADRQGMTPLALARARAYSEMVAILVAAGGR